VELLAQMQIKTEEHLKALETDQRQTHKEIRRFVRFARAILADHETRLLNLEPEEDEDGSEGNGQGPSSPA
jgi:hypothetical protein